MAYRLSDPVTLGGASTLDSSASLRALAAQGAADDAAALKASNEEHADFRTRAARAEIKKLAPTLTGPEAASLLSALISAFGESLELRTCEAGARASDSLLDAVAALEE